MLAHPPNPTPARDSNLASRQSTTPPRPRDLPWNPSTAQMQDQLTGRDPKVKSSTGLGPATFLRRPDFREWVYRVSGHPKAAYATQVPSKFRVLKPPEKATAHSRPFITDFDMSNMEVQLHCANILLYQDWFLGSVLHLSEQLQTATTEHTLTQKLLHDLQEFVFSASRTGYNARQHVCHLFNTVLRRRDTCQTLFHDYRPPPSRNSSERTPWTILYSLVSQRVILHSRRSLRLQISPALAGHTGLPQLCPIIPPHP